MPLWAKYDRANGRIVAIDEADQAPLEDKLIAVIECSSATKVGDFIGDPEGTDDAQEPEQNHAAGWAPNPNAPIGKPPPSPPGHEGEPPPGHGGTPPGQANKPQPKDE